LKKATDATLFHVESGGGAIEYLAGQGRFFDRTKIPLRIFALTGSGEMGDRERVKGSGVVEGYFVKPLTAENVAAILT